jgi:hypothetical protein
MHWFSARKYEKKVREVRQEERKRIGEKREGEAHWQGSKSAGDACSCADLRREIWAAWRPDSRRGGE